MKGTLYCMHHIYLFFWSVVVKPVCQFSSWALLPGTAGTSAESELFHSHLEGWGNKPLCWHLVVLAVARLGVADQYELFQDVWHIPETVPRQPVKYTQTGKQYKYTLTIKLSPAVFTPFPDKLIIINISFTSFLSFATLLAISKSNWSSSWTSSTWRRLKIPRLMCSPGMQI